LALKPISQEVFAYLRFVEPAAQPVLVLLNFSEEPAEAVFELPEPFKPAAEDGFWLDVLAGEPIQAGSRGPLKVLLPGLAVKILLQKDKGG
jgi:hypothetical protein